MDPELASSIALFGAGPIGILLLQVLKLKGAADVTVVDKNPTRAEFALKKGADETLTSLDDLKRDDFDAVVDATGVIPVMNMSLNYVRLGGKVLLFGIPPAGEEITFDAFQIFRKGLTILSSFTSLRNSYQALDLLKHDRLSLDGLISHKLLLDDFQKGVALLEEGLDDVRKVMILPND